MNQRWIGIFAVAVGATTLTWIILLGIAESGTPPIESLDDKVAAIEAQGALHAATYLNASALTFLTVLFMTTLYVFCREQSPGWSAIGFVFVPIYGLANLVSYLSQVWLIPRLLEMAGEPASRDTALALLALSIHTWPGSLIEALNGMAYAVLGVPAILLPLAGMRRPRLLAIGGYLLIASGVMSILAFAGLVASAGYLTGLSVAGGVVYLVSLGPIAIHFLRR